MLRRAKYCGKACFNKSQISSRVVIRRDRGYAELRLSCGAVAKISIEDAGWVAGRSWSLEKGRSGARYVRGGTDRLHVLIARPPKGMVVDHWNRNGLDNRRKNLKVVPQAINCQNRKDANGYWPMHWECARVAGFGKLARLGRVGPNSICALCWRPVGLSRFGPVSRQRLARAAARKRAA
jgi:hypothetical protein